MFCKKKIFNFECEKKKCEETLGLFFYIYIFVFMRVFIYEQINLWQPLLKSK